MKPTNTNYKNITMLVRCISTLEVEPDNIKKGQYYQIDRLSIRLDSYGDAYGFVYDSAGNPIGEKLLKHFQCL